jgi:hypothetical protein
VASTCTEEGKVTDGVRGFLGEHLALLQKGYSFSGYERNLFFRNNGDGTFTDISGVSGADSIRDGRGCVFADFDDDGDLDLFVRAMHGPAHLYYRNRVGQDAGWVRVVLEGTRSGRDAFGTIVRLKTALGVQTKVKCGGSGFVSQSDPRLLFGLGDAAAAEWIEIAWPSGARQRIAAPGALRGRTLRFLEPRE